MGPVRVRSEALSLPPLSDSLWSLAHGQRLAGGDRPGKEREGQRGPAIQVSQTRGPVLGPQGSDWPPLVTFTGHSAATPLCPGNLRSTPVLPGHLPLEQPVSTQRISRPAHPGLACPVPWGHTLLAQTRDKA